ncbi:MAG: 4-hydroxy-3-methylbut-2-enyl diphosphate reductase [Candidatus Omnitrophica bacterium]|nr:4-hydroxy-3-methylbut-2-enyl diphosphate reductase [Candidatus Omnitrophota bacterium]
MEINIAKSSGFCFGVKRAIDMCMELAGGDEAVYILGDIVHNEHVVETLAKKGIKKLRKIKRPPEGSVLVIRAHGAPRQTFLEAGKAGFRIVDATCPMVKDIYKIGRKLEKTHKIIIIGDAGHDEVKGIAGQLDNEPVIIESPEAVPAKAFSGVRKAAVITQSTQTKENIQAIMEKLKSIIPRVQLHDTTCRTTVVKQQQIKKLPRENDVVLIVGSRTSANTKRLYQIARKIKKRTHWISSSKDLKKEWFRGARKVGIMAGASTPDEVTRSIVKKLRSWT